MEPINPNRTGRWTRVCSLDHLVYGHQPFAERDLWNILGGLLRFDVGGTYHLAPLLGFICDELAEVGRRAGKCAGSEFGDSRLDLKIGKSSVNFLVELEHDFGGYIFRRGDTEPRIGLITRQEFGYGWNVWQIAPTLACRNRQCAQRSALDVLHRGDRPKEGNLHPAAKQIGIRSARAPVGYMQQVDAGRQLEWLASHVGQRTSASRSHVDL